MLQKELNWKKQRNEKVLYKVIIYLRPSYLIKWFRIIMTTGNIEINKVIIGAFFGAIYSVVLIAPLTFIMDNKHELKIIFYPLTILIAFAIINRSLTMKSSKGVTGNLFKRLIDYQIFLKDIVLAMAIIIVSLIMWYYDIMNLLNSFMWLVGVAIILILQNYSISKILDENIQRGG